MLFAIAVASELTGIVTHGQARAIVRTALAAVSHHPALCGIPSHLHDVVVHVGGLPERWAVRMCHRVSTPGCTKPSGVAVGRQISQLSLPVPCMQRGYCSRGTMCMGNTELELIYGGHFGVCCGITFCLGNARIDTPYPECLGRQIWCPCGAAEGPVRWSEAVLGLLRGITRGYGRSARPADSSPTGALV